jgi:hypothetical protein
VLCSWARPDRSFVREAARRGGRPLVDVVRAVLDAHPLLPEQVFEEGQQ